MAHEAIKVIEIEYTDSSQHSTLSLTSGPAITSF